ncbi:M23 family metallopeptidase [Saccharopolyspora sp. NPDC050642]|uniref:M23 family metallopeptidase n=1 Tax=Saccharopolyspora sp. NPDC050642 TaxID=3157099 RepID=UPI0033D21BBC
MRRRAAEAARQREAAEREAQRKRVVWPVEGRITSKPGARWGTTQASGFGLWVRVRHEDGTITVYGHINRALVTEGECVEAGDVIAEVGNRGQSTGPHLHFEVWDADSRKMNPLRWLQNNGARP